jgi:hypothetical protein
MGAQTPLALVLASFTAGAFLRSLQFTALNALSYADIERAEVAKAASFYSVAQQLSLSAGVAVGALALEFLQWQRGDVTLAAGDFSLAFFVVAVIAMASVVQYLRLANDAGSAVLVRKAPDNAGARATET